MQPWFIEFWLTGAGASIVGNDNGRGEGETTESAFDNETTRELFQTLDAMQDEGLLDPVPGTEGQFDHYFAIGLQQASMTIATSTAVTTVKSVLEGTLDDTAPGLAGELTPHHLTDQAAPPHGLAGPNRENAG